MSTFRRLHPFVLAAAAAAAGLGLSGAATGQASDPTPPVITPSVTGTLGDNGWHRSNATVGWSVSDPESGITETRGCDTRTQAQDTTGVSRTCEAVNGAGLTGSYTVVVKVDKTPPTVTATLERAADVDGWHTSPVLAFFSGTDQTSTIASCSLPLTYEGPDTTRTDLTGSCRDRAGNEASGSVAVKYDTTAPVVTKIVPARRADRYGWFNRPVRFVAHGRDATSGVATCDSPRYAGPSTARASVSATGRDRAGHVGPARTATFKYAKPLLTPARGHKVRAPVYLRWVPVERAKLYNVQIWRGSRKVMSAWPRGTSYRLPGRWSYAGERYRLKPGHRYRWYVLPRIGSRYGKLLGKSAFDVRRARGTAGGSEIVPTR